MGKLIATLLFCFALGLSGPASAEREVHVVAVGKGQPPKDFRALPVARVLVDRPGQEVGLVLLDGGALRWQIEASEGTRITEILRSGPAPEDSEVLLSGIPVVGVNLPGLPLVFQPRGRDFRRLVKVLNRRMRVERLHSFHGRHLVRETAVRVTRIDKTTAGLARDHLSDRLGEFRDLPAVLQDRMATVTDPDPGTATIDPSGITLTAPDGRRHYPVSPDMPPILLPVLAVHVPERQRVFGLTLGAEGYIYAVDTLTGRWQIAARLNGYDAAGMMFDPGNRQFILTGAFSRPGDIRVIGLDGSRSSIFIPVIGFPGLSDLFDYGNEHGPPLIPRAYAEGWLLLEASAGALSDGAPFRIYAVDIRRGEVRLLRYREE